MNRASRLFGFLVLALLAFAASAAGQGKKRGPQLRTVRGQVFDKQENVLPKSVIYLKNTRTQTVKTHIADDEGKYRFSGLDPNVDYEIHAEHDGQTSQTRTVSSFDSRKEIILNLKVNRKRAG